MIEIINIHDNYSTNPPKFQEHRRRKIDEKSGKSPEKTKKWVKVVVFLTICAATEPQNPPQNRKKTKNGKKQNKKSKKVLTNPKNCDIILKRCKKRTK